MIIHCDDLSLFIIKRTLALYYKNVDIIPETQNNLNVATIVSRYDKPLEKYYHFLREIYLNDEVSNEIYLCKETKFELILNKDKVFTFLKCIASTSFTYDNTQYFDFVAILNRIYLKCSQEEYMEANPSKYPFQLFWKQIFPYLDMSKTHFVSNLSYCRNFNLYIEFSTKN